MRPARPIITVNDYDKDDEPGCGCETCTSPWGAEALPLLMHAARAQRDGKVNTGKWLTHE